MGGIASSFNSPYSTVKNTFKRKNLLEKLEKEEGRGYNDKYKHAYISCEGAKDGYIGAATVGAMGAAREAWQIVNGENTVEASSDDMQANMYGIRTGLRNRLGNCNDLVQKKYPKYNKR